MSRGAGAGRHLLSVTLLPFSKTALVLQVLQSEHQVQPAAQFDVPRARHLLVVV